jgi:hypothetical protein
MDLFFSKVYSRKGDVPLLVDALDNRIDLEKINRACYSIKANVLNELSSPPISPSP